MERGMFSIVSLSKDQLADVLVQPRGSFESIEKGSNSQDKIKEKEEKKRKDKKPGMLSGLFKRKKSKDDIDDPERSPAESAFRTSPQPKTSMESISSKSVSPEQQRPSKPQKNSNNKLHKQPPGIMKVDPVLDPTMAEFARGNEAINQSQGSKSIRQVPLQEERESSYEDCGIVLQSPISQSSPSKDPFATPLESMDPLESPVDRPSSEAQWRGPNDPGRTTAEPASVTSPPQKSVPTLVAGDESESPVNISPVEAYSPMSARGSTNNASPREVRSLSPPSPPSSPGQEVNYLKGITAAPASVGTLSVETPTWSDSSLRSYMDEENDIRDLFIIVHDKSNVPPAGPDHPITGRLFKEESKRLKEMNNQLDDMLVNWMSQRTNNSTSTRGIQSPPV